METCRCGVPLRQFWVWRDTKDVLHASSFPPSSGTVRSLLAATTRDALLPVAIDPRMPKHDVRDLDDPSLFWEGRCSAAMEAAG